jgi:hypothetical protein
LPKARRLRGLERALKALIANGAIITQKPVPQVPANSTKTIQSPLFCNQSPDRRSLHNTKPTSAQKHPVATEITFEIFDAVIVIFLPNV